MSENPTSPLLGSTAAGRPASKRSIRSNPSTKSNETTPLLARSDVDDFEGGLNREPSSPARSSLQSLHSRPGSKAKRRWPTFVALGFLVIIVIAVIIFGFLAPAVVEEYAQQAVIFEPTKLAIDSFTAGGVRAKVQGDFVMDAARVEKNFVRNIGRFCTWVASKVETTATVVEVSLPEYGAIVLGTAAIPPIVVSIRNGAVTHVDILADLTPGNMEGIRIIANDWVDGRLGQLRVQTAAEVGLKSGIFPLGNQTLKESLVFKGHDLPTLPRFNISRLNIHETKPDAHNGQGALEVLTSIRIENKFPIQLDVPSAVFDILVPNCMQSDPIIAVGNATTSPIVIRPRKDVVVDVQGLVAKLPKVLTAACPDSNTSPLDLLLAEYMKGDKTTIFVKGSQTEVPGTPPWMSELLSSITLPLPFPGHTFDKLIKSFSFTNVHFSLPDPMAGPNSPESHPRVSANIKALVAVPKEMNFSLNVSRVRAQADVSYKGQNFGVLDLHKWQEASSEKTKDGDGIPSILVQSEVTNAPLEITDNDVFTQLIQDMLFGGNGVVLGTKADVDVDIQSALGEFVVRKIPAEGDVVVAPISDGGVGSLTPKVSSLELLDTTQDSITFQARLNLTNPTQYSAMVPYTNVHILCNDTLLGNAVLRNASIKPGVNDNVVIQSIWNPSKFGGSKGAKVGTELLSQYISGWNTTLTIRTHAGTIPSQPDVGEALSAFPIDIPTPHLQTPKKPGDDEDPDKHPGKSPRFIDDATMYIFSSTATFTLTSPLPHSTLYITRINATALYNHTEPVGGILYDTPFAVPPGSITTPALPVDWSLGSVGFNAIKSALGGSLKLDAFAHVGVKVDNWSDEIWFKGEGIGAEIRF
ncbi:MAG: hypothetical protein M1814_004720 [Vezdaea aestivalis]|nr:MAG: hypothetical protein M1814_004720 [Vezdaea aestivalis]